LHAPHPLARMIRDAPESLGRAYLGGRQLASLVRMGL
jgi:hypothetical protein